MLDVQTLQKAGTVPGILIFGGWIYAGILSLVVLYHLFMFCLKLWRSL
ncbi:hypothetical protein [Bacillus multifaciens]|nr:hypothetical protein [Bacillus sp. WLY-B-L8]MDP7978033.1 hypothetical protein [Bacillus sp. WLY-B-L8]